MTRGGKDLCLESIRKEIWGTNLEAITETESMREHRLPVYLPWFAQFAFHTTQDQLTGGGNTHSGLGPTTSIKNSENAPTYLVSEQSDGDIFSVRVLSSRMTKRNECSG